MNDPMMNQDKEGASRPSARDALQDIGGIRARHYEDAVRRLEQFEKKLEGWLENGELGARTEHVDPIEMRELNEAAEIVEEYKEEQIKERRYRQMVETRKSNRMVRENDLPTDRSDLER